MTKIVELVQNKDYDKLKSLLEAKVAKKIKEAIDAKKEKFISKMKSGKKSKECSLTESDHVFSQKLYDKLGETFKNIHGGLIQLGKYKIMVDVTSTDVEVHILKGDKKTQSLAFESTPITKGVSHAAAFVTQLANDIITPDYTKEKGDK